MGEWEQMASALASLGEDASVLSDQETALVMAEGHHLLGLREVPGLHIQARESEEGVQARIEVAEGVRIQRPVHLCFGLLRRYGGQRILLDVQVGKGAEVTFMAHCLFMFAEMAEHRMEASMVLEEGARVSYHEGHYHGPFGGIEVLPKARIRVGKGARFENTFSLTSGRVGKLVLDVQVEVEEKGVAELISKVFGHGADTVMIREKAILSGKGARGLVKSRV
ncbi:MAG: FeS assembly protein SufBD, partial [Gammaproteobacteria bacterium]